MTLRGETPHRRLTYTMLTYVARLAIHSVAFNYSQGLRPFHASMIQSLKVVFSRGLLGAHTMLVDVGCTHSDGLAYSSLPGANPPWLSGRCLAAPLVGGPLYTRGSERFFELLTPFCRRVDTLVHRDS